MVSSKPETHPKRRPGGIYDKDLLCDACEKRFNTCDDYAARLFLQILPTNGQPMVASTGEVMGFGYHGINYDLLKRFAVALAWRASVSSIEFCGKVDLGRYADRARELILAESPGTQNDFEVLITRWVAQERHEPLTQVQFSPYTTKLNGVNVVKFLLAGAVIYVRVDQRPYPSPLPELALQASGDLFVLAREFEGSRDLSVFRPALEAAAARYGRTRSK